MIRPVFDRITSLPTVFFLVLLSIGIFPENSFSQHLQGDRMIRSPYLEMRSYNREFGRYFGYGGFGGTLFRGGPVVGTTSLGFGIYPEKTGTQVMDLSESFGESDTRIVDKSFDGWGVDLKYQFHAFLNGKVDESGPFIRWGASLHTAFLNLKYDVDWKELREHTNYEEGRKDKLDFYLESGLGYQLDMGFSNLDVELHAGVPVITGLYRSVFLVAGETDEFGALVDMDQHNFAGMPFYWGLRAGILI